MKRFCCALLILLLVTILPLAANQTVTVNNNSNCLPDPITHVPTLTAYWSNTSSGCQVTAYKSGGLIGWACDNNGRLSFLQSPETCKIGICCHCDDYSIAGTVQATNGGNGTCTLVPNQGLWYKTPGCS